MARKPRQDFSVSKLVLFECCFAWMLWKLGRIDGDPVLRETRIWATWEYVSSVGEWYLEICRGGQETLGTSGGVLLPKTKLDQSRPNPGIVGQLENEVRKLREPLIVMAAQLIRDRVEMECLEGAWGTLEGNTRCRFRAPFDSWLLLWCIQMNLHGRFSARWSGQLLGLVLYTFEAQQSDDHGKMKLDQLIDKVQKLWDSSPEPMKKFPHNKASDNFIQLILDLILVVVKYLVVPVFAVTDASSIGACRPRIFFINGFLCFLEDQWQRNGERERERRRHFKEKMSLEEAHHHRRPWIRAWRKKEMNEGKGREEHEILCSK
ncbi:hypothetical protein D0Y65_023993 [Glycine soja]|uniref:Uncharacterized protein n=1 Tax=Glycine soja TaxID=3848 RepID=A0A445J099_GLYSO|nr:hypothetical protein D0Y65_023993 [Glycine soja]